MASIPMSFSNAKTRALSGVYIDTYDDDAVLHCFFVFFFCVIVLIVLVNLCRYGWSSFFFFHSVLRWSVAVSTMRRQSSRIAALLQADARPMFCWPRSASTARSQVWLGLPNGRFQSGGSPRITAATARRWSSCGELPL